MPGLVISGQQIQVPELVIANWLDDPRLRLKMGEDGTPRTGQIHGVCMHSTKGWPDPDNPVKQLLLPGKGPSDKDRGVSVAKYWSTNGKAGGATIVVDHDGDIVCTCDLQTEAAYHCPGVNQWSLGIELYQGSKGEFYDYQLEKAVLLIEFLCSHWSIPRVIPSPYKGQPRPAIVSGSWSGVFGHRDAHKNRGFGDPGDFIFQKLAEAGFSVEEC